MTIGQRILQIRITAGLSQEEFGEKLGTSRQTVSKWELDTTIPEIDKIVRMSRVFSVTTDSILVDGISTFDAEVEPYVCGIYKSDTMEIVETERVALVYSSDSTASVFGVKAYVGFEAKKKLVALCEYTAGSGKVAYAYITDTGNVFSNSETMEAQLGQKYEDSPKKSLYRTEVFYVKHGKEPLPTVDEAGIKRCLTQWRLATKYSATSARFSILLCTDKTEYVFDIAPEDTNIYCAISFNTTTEMGLLCGKQFFRIRNYRENTDVFCSSYANLGLRMPEKTEILTGECVGGSCSNTSQGLFFGVKRYSGDEIVLCGCGGDEYRYSRKDTVLERFTLK